MVEEFIVQSGAAQFTRGRALAIVAVRHGLALGVLAYGPYFAFTDLDHPSGTDLYVAKDLGPYVNSFMWRGDPPR